MEIVNLLTDDAVLAELGGRLSQHRIELGKVGRSVPGEPKRKGRESFARASIDLFRVVGVCRGL